MNNLTSTYPSLALTMGMILLEREFNNDKVPWAPSCFESEENPRISIKNMTAFLINVN